MTLNAFLRSLGFPCRHNRIGMPVTWEERRGVKITTVLCQDCGARLNYDWDRMQQGKVHREPGIVVNKNSQITQTVEGEA